MGSHLSHVRYVLISLKALLHYAFLACGFEENARGLALGNLQAFFF